jgi:hypothetical protein
MGSETDGIDCEQRKDHGMKLLTKAIEAKLPAFYSQEGRPLSEQRIWVKFFNPCGAGTWYGSEYDPETRTFFGYAQILPDGGELGYFSLDELESLQLPFGLKIERDLHWDDETTLQTVVDRGW